MKTGRLTPADLISMKQKKERIAALTAYDYTSAQILDAAGIPMLLVGDTLGMVLQGEETTIPVTLDHIIYHAAMVTRGAKRALVVADMPFLTYQICAEDALRNAGRLMQEAKVGAVKIEGGKAIAPTIRRMVDVGIPVCGHLGFTPQSTHTLGGPRIQGRTLDDAEALIADALALAEAGVFAIVLELVPTTVAAEISRLVPVPTIGIGAGPECDGEVQVFHDLFGLYTDFKPRHTKRYAHVAEHIAQAAKQYLDDVSRRVFPGPEQSSDLTPELKQQLQQRLQNRLANAAAAAAGKHFSAA